MHAIHQANASNDSKLSNSPLKSGTNAAQNELDARCTDINTKMDALHSHGNGHRLCAVVSLPPCDNSVTQENDIQGHSDFNQNIFEDLNIEEESAFDQLGSFENLLRDEHGNRYDTSSILNLIEAFEEILKNREFGNQVTKIIGLRTNESLLRIQI